MENDKDAVLDWNIQKLPSESIINSLPLTTVLSRIQSFIPVVEFLIEMYNAKIFRLLTQSYHHLKYSSSQHNHGLWEKQCNNDILIENIASVNAIMFARQYLDHMKYL